jgi:hypothetical protein
LRIAYDNLINNDLLLSVSSENSNYPVSNLDSSILTTTWRTLTHDSESVIFDAGAGNVFDIDVVLISGHNLTSAATITVQTDDDVAFGSPTVNTVLTWRDSHIIGYITGGERYVKFIFDDPTNPLDYIEIGKIYAGSFLQMSPSSNLPFKVLNQRNDVIQVTDQGALYGSPGVSRRVFQYDFMHTSDTMIESLRTVLDTVGNYSPIYLLNYDLTFTHHDICYGRIVNNLEETILGGKQNTYSLQIEECK